MKENKYDDHMTVRIDSNLKTEFKNLCVVKGISTSSYLRYLMERAILHELSERGSGRFTGGE